MKLRYLFTLSCLLFSIGAQADMYKRVDADGHVTYSSTPIKGGKKIHLEPLPTMLPQSTNSRSEGSSSFPRVDSETQRGRDGTRRQILQDELSTEQKALEEARAKLQEAQDTPEVHKGANGQTFRDVGKYEENVSAAKDEVRLHEKNIDALNTELSNLNR